MTTVRGRASAALAGMAVAFAPAPALAHDLGRDGGIERLLATAALPAATLLGALVSLRALEAAADRGRRALRHDVPRAVASLAGLVALGVALSVWVDRAADETLLAHMSQHLLLVLVAAPLLVLGFPPHALLRASPRGARRRLGRWARRVPRARGAEGALVLPLAAMLHAAVLVGWHAPAAYEAALHRTHVHLLEHASLLATALLFWSLVARRGTGRGHALGGLFVLAATGAALGALMTFSSTPWYPHYATALGDTALDDQRAAGLLMWMPAGAGYAVAAAASVVAWLRDVDHQLERREAGRRARERRKEATL